MSRLRRGAVSLGLVFFLQGCPGPCLGYCDGFLGTIVDGVYAVESVSVWPEEEEPIEGWSWDEVERTGDTLVVRFTDGDGNAHEATYTLTDAR